MNQQQLENLKALAKKADNEQWPGQSGFGSRFAKGILQDDEEIIEMFEGASFGQGVNSRANISWGLSDVQKAVGSESFKVPYPMPVAQAEKLGILTSELSVRQSRDRLEIVVPRIPIRKARQINQKNS